MSLPFNESQVIGCIQGVAIGDALGAPYEGGILEKAVWQLIQLSSKSILYTDDTQTTLDVINSMIERQQIDADDIARKMGDSYTWFKGYGKNSANILKKIRRGANWRELKEATFKGGSYGNGAAIRACPIGLYFAVNLDDNLADLQSVSKEVASVTHSHPLGEHGAYLIAYTVALIVNQVDKLTIMERLIAVTTISPYQEKLSLALKWLEQNQPLDIKQTRKQLGNDVAAQDCVVTAIYLALAHFDQSIETLVETSIALGGDTDSIASMACGLWGAHHGHTKIPARLFDKIEDAALITSKAKQLFEMIKARDGG